MKRYVMLWLVLVLIGCGAGEGALDSEPPPSSVEITVGESVAAVRESAAIPAATSKIVLADGQLVAVQPTVTLSFEANGRLLSLNVQVGDWVAAGEVIATLDDTTLQETLTNANLQVSQSENSLAQAQLALDDLLNWQPKAMEVSLAEANLAAAQASLNQTQSQADAAGNNLTSANVAITQAQRGVTDAQTAYNKAHDPGRDWELNIQGLDEALKAEREATAQAVLEADEALSLAYAQWQVTATNLTGESAIANAEAAVVNAQQALETATTGPTAHAIATARLQVEQAEIALEQSRFSQQQAQRALTQAQLVAPVNGTVLSVAATPGTMMSAGLPVVTLLDTSHLAFHTSNLSERDLAQVQVGQPAEVRLKTYGERPLSGTVVRIAPQAGGMVGDAATFTAVIQLDETDLDLRPGMTGRVEIVGEG